MDELLVVRIDAGAKADVVRGAEIAGLTVSAFTRKAVLAAADAVLEESP